jgi:hypothetical protein
MFLDLVNIKVICEKWKKKLLNFTVPLSLFLRYFLLLVVNVFFSALFLKLFCSRTF